MDKKFIRLGGIVFVVAVALATAAQESKVALALVARAAVPLYPPLARAAHIEGVAHVKVTTDGHRVIATHTSKIHSRVPDFP